MKIKTRSATEGPLGEILKKAGAAIKDGAREFGLGSKKRNDKQLQELYGMDRKQTKEKNILVDDSKLDKEAMSAKGEKYILATGEKDGKKQNFVVKSTQKLSEKDVTNLVESEAKKQGITNAQKMYVVSGDEGKKQADKWPTWQAGARINRGGGTEGQDSEIGKFDYDIKKAQQWNRQFIQLSDAKKYEFLKQHFPKSIKSSNAIFQKALLKEKDPFTSDMYVFLYKYASTNNKDISESAAKYMLSNWDVVAMAFDKKMQGLDLSKDANQLAAAAYIEKNHLDIPYRNKNTTWMSYKEIKENISAHQFTDEEKKSIQSGGAGAKKLSTADSKASASVKRKALIALLGDSQKSFIEGLNDEDLNAVYIQFEPTIKSGGPKVT